MAAAKLALASVDLAALAAETLYVSGRVVAAPTTRWSLGAEPHADQIVGFKLPKTRAGWTTKPKFQVVDLAADGSFQFSFTARDRTGDWVLAIVDHTQSARFDRFVGFVGINDGGDGLIRLPMAAARSNLALGDLTPPPAGFDVALSDASLDDLAKNFTIGRDDLAALAKSDALLRNVKNLILNAGLVARPSYAWAIDGSRELEDDEVADGNALPASLADAAEPALATYSLIGKGSILPPQAVVAVGGTPRRKLTSKTHLLLQDAPEVPVPTGAWHLENHAVVDVAVTAPYVRQGSRLVPVIYIPSLHVILDARGDVTALEIKWWQHSRAGLQQVLDMNYLLDLAETVDVTYMGKPFAITRAMVDALADKSVIQLPIADGRKYDDETNRSTIAYSVAGVDYAWTWH